MKQAYTTLLLGTLFSILSCTPLYAQESLERIRPQKEHLEDISLALPEFRMPKNSEEQSQELYQTIPVFPQSLCAEHTLNSEIYPNSSYYLIHIKQSHLPDIEELIERFDTGTEGEQDRIADQVNQIIDIQYDIVGIYQDLRTHLGITDIYTEGFTQEMIPQLPERDVISQESYEFFLQDQTLQEAFTVIQEYRAEFTFEAVLFLYNMGFADIKAAEQSEAYTRAGEVFEQTKTHIDPRAIRTHIFENREDALLENITQQENEYVVTVYGSMHSWQNNIDKWNEQHPENTISLIEITPQSLMMIPPLPEQYSENTYKPSD